MRLICPGCDAEYRIPEKAIPPEGREVECSDCGRVWHGERAA
ncbi:MAG: zinc-ribbon domain-containing protein, partial [Paracoccus sp.]|nr:zinc-ribbon domain-containing protein [Paracoccus sp. (in: a-proteobacteria)]